jgi:RHS repeat-associated protein
MMMAFNKHLGSSRIADYHIAAYSIGVDELLQQREYQHATGGREFVDLYPLTDLLHRTVALTDDRLCGGSSSGVGVGGGDNGGTGGGSSSGVPFMPRFVEVYDTDVCGRTKIYTGPGADGHWFTDDDVPGNVPLCRYLYTGREYDPETGLYYYRARYYSPELGRFISRDPLGYGGGSMGLYEYGAGNPAVNVDPSGEIVGADDALIIIGAIVILGAISAAVLDSARQGVQMIDDPSKTFSWAEVADSALFGALMAPAFAFAPEIMIPLATGMSIISGINELGQGNKATATFDFAAGLLPLASRSVGRGLMSRGAGISGLRTRMAGRYRTAQLEEMMFRHAVKTWDVKGWAGASVMEVLHGTMETEEFEGAHVRRKHGPYLTSEHLNERVRTGKLPFQDQGPVPRSASKFLTWRDVHLAMAEAMSNQRQNPGQKAYLLAFGRDIGEGVKRIGSVKNPKGVTPFVSQTAVFNFDVNQPGKFYTGFPESP